MKREGLKSLKRWNLISFLVCLISAVITCAMLINAGKAEKHGEFPNYNLILVAIFLSVIFLAVFLITTFALEKQRSPRPNPN